MSSQTTNLHLVKPSASESADIADINGNMDILDAAVAGKANATHDHAGQALTPASVAATGAVSGTSISDGTGTLAALRESVSKIEFVSVSKVVFQQYSARIAGFDIYDESDNHLGVTFTNDTGQITIWYNGTSLRTI